MSGTCMDGMAYTKYPTLDRNKDLEMSKEQYNLTKPTNYLKRTMFLDPAGPVTVQRFEEVKYNKLQKY